MIGEPWAAQGAKLFGAACYAGLIAAVVSSYRHAYEVVSKCVRAFATGSAQHVDNITTGGGKWIRKERGLFASHHLQSSSASRSLSLRLGAGRCGGIYALSLRPLWEARRGGVPFGRLVR